MHFDRRNIGLRARERASNRVRAIIVAVLMLAASHSAWSQAHTRQFGAYNLRSSTVGTENLSEEAALAHGIVRDPRRAVLNVTVTKKEAGIDMTVPSRVQARARNLTGHAREIEMREVAVQGRVSYMGIYEFEHGEVLDFTITAQPDKSEKTLTMTYRDRLWVRDLPNKPS